MRLLRMLIRARLPYQKGRGVGGRRELGSTTDMGAGERLDHLQKAKIQVDDDNRARRRWSKS